jgi:hypothetical protein
LIQKLKQLLLAIILALAIHPCMAQDPSMFLPKEPPRDAKQNTTYLFYGLALQVAGLGITAGSIWILTEGVEDTDSEVYFSGIGFGVGLTAAGAALMIGSISNMIKVRHSIHDLKKEQKIKDVSFRIEPTQHGIGLVCRF